MQGWNQLGGHKDADVNRINNSIMIIEYVNNPYFSKKEEWKVKYDDKFTPIGA